MRNLSKEELERLYEVCKNLTFGEKKEIEENTGLSFKNDKVLTLEKKRKKIKIGLFPV